jgi:hypothetical protein
MRKKKQTYSKIIPALALLGGAYLLLSKSSTPTPNNTGGTTGGGVAPIDTGNTSTGLSAFNAVPVNANITTFQSATSGSQVAGTDIVAVRGSKMPNFKTWRGRDWYLYVEDLSKAMGRKNAIKSAFQTWNSPENSKYSFMPNEAAFLLGLAMAEKMPYINKKGMVESGDYGHINTNDKIGNIPVDRPILWDSQPVYDTYYGWWYGVEPWSCQDWIDWHKALERKYNSTQRANDIWRSAWFSSENSGANAVIENNWYYCPRDCDNFVKYFAKKGITDTGGGFTAPIYCNLTGIVTEIVGGVEDGVAAMMQVNKVLNYVYPVAIIALGYFAYKRVLPAVTEQYLNVKLKK